MRDIKAQTYAQLEQWNGAAGQTGDPHRVCVIVIMEMSALIQEGKLDEAIDLAKTMVDEYSVSAQAGSAGS